MLNMRKINKANQHYVNIKKDTFSSDNSDFEKLLHINFTDGSIYLSPKDISGTQIKKLIEIIHADDINFFIEKVINTQPNQFIPYEVAVFNNRKRILTMLIEQKSLGNVLKSVSLDNQFFFINQVLHILPEIYEQYKSEFLHSFFDSKEKITDIKYKPFRDEVIENLIVNNAPVIRVIMGEVEKEDNLNKRETHNIVLDVIEKIESCGLPFFISIKNMKEEFWIKNLLKIYNNEIKLKEDDKNDRRYYGRKILEKIKEADILLTSIFYGNYLQLFLRQTSVDVFDEIVKYSVQNEIDFLYAIDKEISENPLPLGYNSFAQENYEKLYAIIERKELNETLEKSKIASTLYDTKRI